MGIILPIELLPAAVAEVQVFPVENQFTVRAHWIASKAAEFRGFLVTEIAVAAQLKDGQR